MIFGLTLFLALVLPSRRRRRRGAMLSRGALTPLHDGVGLDHQLARG